MIIPEFVKEYIRKCVNSKGYLHPGLLKKYSTQELKEWISFYNGYTFNHIFHLIKLELDDIPLCPICGSKVFNFYKGKIYCSRECSYKSELSKEKAKKTNLERYGVEYSTQSDKVKDKIKSTNIKRYGFEQCSKNESVKEKMKQTNLEKYGTTCSLQNSNIYEKAKNTWIKKYGVDHFSKSEEIKEKKKLSNLEKYGMEHIFQTDSFKEKTKKTNLERYGVEYNTQSDEIKDKIKSTNMKRYGTNYSSQNDFIKLKTIKSRKLSRYNEFSEQIKNCGIELLDTKEEFTNNKEHLYYCLRCNTQFLSEGCNIQHVICPICIKKNISDKEIELREFIEKINKNIILANTKKVIYPLELDIYIPDKNLAIEFNGDYWHSEYYKDKNYHLDKTLKCNSKGIKLIHIFEHEWASKRLIVESIIRNKLGLIENKIYARKTIVKELTSKEYRSFLELNHIQGPVNSKYRYGLFYNSELVSVIGFGLSRFKKGEMELHRFCSKLNYNIIGGFSKLIKYFINQNICSEFITYVDRSKFDAKGYFKVGFELINQIEPSYFYVKKDMVLSRYQTQKHKLSKFLENYDPSLSESDNMILNGYLKVYDCGTLKLIYKKIVDN